MKEQNQVRPGLPPDARAEILETLSANMEIGSDEIVAILKRHYVAEDTGILQDRYRRQLGQRLMASLRDDDGRREVMSNGKGRYFCVGVLPGSAAAPERPAPYPEPDAGPGCHGGQGTGAHPRIGSPEKRTHAGKEEKSGMKGLDKAEELKELYERVASQYDPDGFRLYFAAQEITGIKRLWEEYPSRGRLRPLYGGGRP